MSLAKLIPPLSPIKLLLGLIAPARLLGLLPIVDLALAVPVRAVVFADDIIFLKKLLFFAVGVPKPPNTLEDCSGFWDQSAVGVRGGCEAEPWLW